MTHQDVVDELEAAAVVLDSPSSFEVEEVDEPAPREVACDADEAILVAAAPVVATSVVELSLVEPESDPEEEPPRSRKSLRANGVSNESQASYRSRAKTEDVRGHDVRGDGEGAVVGVPDLGRLDDARAVAREEHLTVGVLERLLAGEAR